MTWLTEKELGEQLAQLRVPITITPIVAGHGWTGDRRLLLELRATPLKPRISRRTMNLTYWYGPAIATVWFCIIGDGRYGFADTPAGALRLAWAARWGHQRTLPTPPPL